MHEAARRACRSAPLRVARGRPPPHRSPVRPARVRSPLAGPPNRPRRKTATPRPRRPPPPAASCRSHPDRSTSPPGHPRPGRPPSHVHARGRQTPRPQQAAPSASPWTPTESYEHARSDAVRPGACMTRRGFDDRRQATTASTAAPMASPLADRIPTGNLSWPRQDGISLPCLRSRSVLSRLMALRAHAWRLRRFTAVAHAQHWPTWRHTSH